MWILTMTIFYVNAPFIAVAEYSSKDRCLAAANAWKSSVVGYDTARPMTLCAEK